MQNFLCLMDFVIQCHTKWDLDLNTSRFFKMFEQSLLLITSDTHVPIETDMYKGMPQSPTILQSKSDFLFYTTFVKQAVHLFDQ